ncbi:Aminodeoxychorismate lyase [hydrothermal vent metagenome]|uniref:Aminodeoxychorismate lyase n=1 Tax=hydrothermal vent metagenome TaxID=652676 RepID=A0A1W1E8H3_9ZZZZ
MKNPTPLLLETVRIEGGKAHNLSYHQSRFDKSRYALFGDTTPIDLASHIKAPPAGLYRCRILYAKRIQHIEYLPYTPKPLHRLKILSSLVDYPYKYANREALDTLLLENSDADEIIIEKEGFLTDTTIANIAFFDGEGWITPQQPLLEGTMRAKFIDKGLLRTAHITKKDIQNYTHVALMNAMIGFKILNNITIK